MYAARWPVLALILWFQWKTLWETSSESGAIAFAAGLIAAWSAVWSVTWLVLYRPQWDAKRVQRRKVQGDRKENKGLIAEKDATRSGVQRNGNAIEGKTSSDANGSVQNGSAAPKSFKGVHYRQHAKATTKGESLEKQDDADGETAVYKDEAEERDAATYIYYWQSYPTKLPERIPWTLDLLINFRGPGWNWAVPPLPDLPPFVKAKLGEPVDKASKKGISSTGLHRFDTRRDLFYSRMPYFTVGYLVLDILKTTLMKDPYYIFGPNTYALPQHLANLTPFQLKLFRQCLNAVTVVLALEMVFMLVPLSMSLLTGPCVFGLRGEAWYYSSTWGPFSNILDKGLSGLWGGWWHQTFRFAFAAPTNYLIEQGYIKPRSNVARISALCFAFGISGILHAAGSVTQFAQSNPWQAPVFFILQALGILMQTKFCAYFRSRTRQFPKAVRQAGNLLFVWTWLWYTSWLLVDDFARGGIWLWEPCPISPTRALGFGSGDDSWWTWGDLGIGWYTGKHWWESGISM